MPTDSPRILIVRLSAVGDTVLTLPVLCALRERFPRAHLAWAVQGASASLLKGHSALDQLIIVPKDWVSNRKSFFALRRTLLDGQFEIAIDTQGLTKSAGIAWLSGAKRRIGFRRGEFCGREFSTWLNNTLVSPTRPHVVDQQLELLQPLGISPPMSRSAHVRFDVPRLQPDVTAVAEMIDEFGLSEGFLLIQPGAGWPSKLWPTERYAAVAQALFRQHGVRSVVLWSGDEERQFAEEIAVASHQIALPAPPTTLPQVAELARQARLFLGPDTGPLHLAAAVGCRCVGLYGPMPVTRCGPYGQAHIALQNACLTGGARARRQADNESMKAISTEEVISACQRLLLSAAQPAAA